MARGIVVNLGGEISSLGLVRVEREKLYGSKERIVVDGEGRTCRSAHITADGAAIVPGGGVAMMYVDGDDVIERSDLRRVDATGAPVQTVPSTLGAEQPLVGPVPPSRVLDHAIVAVYQLTPEELGERLGAALARGEIYETRFVYREAVEPSPCFLVQNDQGIFALTGAPHRFDLVRRAVDPEVLDDAADDDLADDLDFSMM